MISASDVRVRGLRCLVAVVMAATVATVAPTTAGAQQDVFSDVTEGVHKPAIDVLGEMGLFEGTLCGEDMFCPGDEIERSTMAVWLIRALAETEPPEVDASRFADVEADAWWKHYVERLAELEITVGCRREPLRYCPDRSVSRAQMASFFVRAFDLEPAESAGFTDIEGGTHDANINALAAAGITVGCMTDPLQYCPNKAVTRAQMATFLARALGLVEVPTTDVRCELLEDGALGCGTQPDEPERTAYPVDVYPWEPPIAGLVPDAYPLCSSNSDEWDGSCLPPSEWHLGPVDPRSRPDETPRQTPLVVEFTAACVTYLNVPCQLLLTQMKWPLDYMGADPQCIMNEYSDRVRAIYRGAWAGAVQDQHSWLNCATVIDPLVDGVPGVARVNDVGWRLSDTGISLPERCRAVLPADIELETRYTMGGTPPTRFELGHAGCDDWADYVESRIRRGTPGSFPVCYRSAKLAEEWMEHHHDVHERYYQMHC